MGKGRERGKGRGGARAREEGRARVREGAVGRRGGPRGCGVLPWPPPPVTSGGGLQVGAPLSSTSVRGDVVSSGGGSPGGRGQGWTGGMVGQGKGWGGKGKVEVGQG